MNTPPRASGFAPFRQRSFRFQWPADLATSWGFEMENIILGWYVLTETGSVVWLTGFAALQFIGTLVAPLFGVASDRLGHRGVLCAMRGSYALLAGLLALLALTGALTPWLVLVVALLSSIGRSSDIGVRNALIAATMPPGLLMGAIGLGRIGTDGARVAGALSGAGLVALLGMGHAYLVVTGLYLMSLALLFKVVVPPHAEVAAPGSPWRDLGDGFAHVWTRPVLLAAIGLAFLVNLLAYPLSGGLLPYVAREVYGLERTGLGLLVASFAAGGLLGSVVLSARGGAMPPGRTMLVASLCWFGLLLLFARLEDGWAGMAVLTAAGFAQSFCVVPMAVMLLRIAQEAFRGRIMGVRMLAIYGLPLGLLAAGPVIETLGFAAGATLYAGAGLLLALGIALRWRAHLWPMAAPANALRG